MCGRRINVGTPAKRGNSRALSGAGRGSERFLVWNLEVDSLFMMRLNELAAVAVFKPRFQKHEAASVDIMRWVWIATREYFSCRVSMGPLSGMCSSLKSHQFAK